MTRTAVPRQFFPFINQPETNRSALRPAVVASAEGKQSSVWAFQVGHVAASESVGSGPAMMVRQERAG